MHSIAESCYNIYFLQSVSYKTILSQTENMLTTLQSSVEGAELEWKKKLETSQR